MIGSSELHSRAARRLSRLLLRCSVAGIGLAFAAGVSAPAYAQNVLPTGGVVTGGEVGIARGGDSLTVRQSTPTGVVSWETFSVGQPNAVHFDNGAGATLNRVRDNVPSRIDGSLTATGSLYLVNPAGVAVGSTGRVETGGSFVGSTLDLADGEFEKAARGEAYTLKGDSRAAVVNAGRIGSLGGDVALVGRTVDNSGDIAAPGGTAALAAGTEVLVQDRARDGGRFVVRAGGAGTSVRNSGSIAAAEVELRANGGNVYALAGNRAGVISATGTATRGGRVFLTAGDAGTVEVTQQVTARKADAAGRTRGGGIRVSGRSVKVAATLDAGGGAVPAAAPSALPPARPSVVDGAGGTVIITGDAVTLADTARIDVSGSTGGVALVGGDYQGGANAANNYAAESVARARTLTVAKGAIVAADGAGDAGRVVLWSDERTDFAGHVSATSLAGRGGDAEVSGKALLGFTGTANLLGPAGAGTLLLDPYNITISSGSNLTSGTSPAFAAAGNDSILSVTTLTDALAGANVSVTTGTGGSQSGNITVAAAITWTAATTLTLDAANKIAINAAITATHASGGLTLKAKAGTAAAPTITTGASGAIDVGTFSLQAGAWVQNTATLPAFKAKDFRLAVDSNLVPTVTFLRATAGTGADAANAYAVADVYGLQGIATVRDKFYKLAADIDAAGTASWNGGDGFLPIGRNATGKYFTGTFDGQNRTIDGLTINRPATDYIGLFGYISGATIRNIGLDGGSVTGNGLVGGLVGAQVSGSITNAYATGSVTGTSGGYVGGLVGYQASGSITNAWASAGVTSTSTGPGARVGGLVGQQDTSGSITNAWASGSVTSTGGASYVGGLVGLPAGTLSKVYATGNVTGAGDVGGLVGQLYGATLTDAYATGSVTGTGTGGNAGGLVGWHNNGSIARAYATGKVTGASTGYAGGLVGGRGASAGAITGAYWDTASTGMAGSIGVNNGGAFTITAVNASTAYTKSTYSGLTFTAAGGWYIFDGDTRPLLRSSLEGFVSGSTYTVNSAEALQLIGMHAAENATSGKTYILASDIDFTATPPSASGVWKTTTVGGAMGYNFVPIGNYVVGESFYGTFDGRGHVIKGLTIDRTSDAGLFGSTGYGGSGATIKNIGLVGGTVTGVGKVGSLVANLRGGSITNAFSTITVNGSGSNSHTGGLVGLAQVSAAITNAYATGAVTGGGSTVGGLVGNLSNGSTIANAYAAGAVTSNGYYVGGLVGEIFGGGVTNVYATGTVTNTLSGSSYRSGGLVGQLSDNGTITNAWASGKMMVNASANSGGLVGYRVSGTINTSYWDRDTTGRPAGIGFNSAGSGTPTAVRSSTGVDAFTKSGYAFSSFDTNWYIIDGVTRPMLRMTLDELGKTYDGAGNVIAGTYTIRNAEALQLIRSHTDAGTSLTSGRTYILASDIDFAAALPDSNVWRTATTKSSAGNYGFLPIGTATFGLEFNGTFDGQGHVIKGLTIVRDGSHVGLFGAIGGATIRNIGLDGGSVRGTSYVGGLVGYQFGGSITNAWATGSVKGDTYVGGLVGWQNGGSITNAYATGSVTGNSNFIGGLVGYQIGSITNAWATGSVTGNSNFVGGLVGDQFGGSITNAWATGSVKGADMVGGLVGRQGSSIINAYATGSVTGNSRVGGLVGVQAGGTITNAYATGSVTGTSEVGGLLGGQNVGASITASFWDTQATGQSNGVGSGSQTGTTGLTTAQLTNTGYFTNLAAPRGWDFETVWAPPGDGHAPELYALSKVIRVHAANRATATYGSTSGAWVGGTPASTIYGAGLNVFATDAYGAPAAFVANPGVAIAGLNAGAYDAAEITGLATAGSNGYRFIYTAGLTVTKATLTIATAGTVTTSRAYDGGTTAAVLTHGVLGGVIGSDAVTLSLGSTQYNSKDVASATTITGTYVLGGAAAGNYQLASSAFSMAGSITPKTLAIATAGTVTTSRAYDGGTAAAVLTHGALGGVIGSDAVTLTLGSTQYNSKDVAAANTITGAYALGGAAAGNYQLASSGFSVAGSITPKTLSIATAGTVTTSRAYDGGTAAAVLTHGALGGVIGLDAVTLSLGSTQYNSQDVASATTITGTYALGGAAAGNYQLGSSGFSVAGGITRAIVMISPVAGQRKIVGDSAFQIAFAAEGWKNGDDDTLLVGALDHDGTTAGNRAITLGSLSAGGNYTLALTSSAMLELFAETGSASGPNQSGAGGGAASEPEVVTERNLIEQLPSGGSGVPGTISVGDLTAGNNAAVEISRNLTALPLADAVLVTASFISTRTASAQNELNADTVTVSVGNHASSVESATAGGNLGTISLSVRESCDVSGRGEVDSPAGDLDCRTIVSPGAVTVAGSL